MQRIGENREQNTVIIVVQQEHLQVLRRFMGAVCMVHPDGFAGDSQMARHWVKAFRVLDAITDAIYESDPRSLGAPAFDLTITRRFSIAPIAKKEG